MKTAYAKDSDRNCLAFTWFRNGETGHQALKYRTSALVREYNAVVVSNVKGASRELNIPVANFIFVPGNDKSLIHKVKYWRSVIRMIKAINPRRVVFLHSFFAPVILFVKKSATALYWNVDPLQMYPYGPKGTVSLLRRFKNRFMVWLSYAGARSSCLLMPVGEELMLSLLARGCKGENVRLIHLGVGEHFILNRKRCFAGNNVGSRRVLKAIYAGGVKKERGRDLMLEVLAKVNLDREKFRLVIVGADQEQFNYCTKMSMSLGISGCLEVLRRIDSEKVASWLDWADIGISLLADTPYYRVSPPTKLFEYFVAGLPVLVNDIQTHNRYVTHWDNGLIVNYDTASLSSALMELWKHQGELERMSKNAMLSGEKYKWRNLEHRFVDAVGSL